MYPSSHLLMYAFTHSPICSCTLLHVCSFACSHTYSLTPSQIFSLRSAGFTRLPTNSSEFLFVRSGSNASIDVSAIRLPIHLSMHLSTSICAASCLRLGDRHWGVSWRPQEGPNSWARSPSAGGRPRLGPSRLRSAGIWRSRGGRAKLGPAVEIRR